MNERLDLGEEMTENNPMRIEPCCPMCGTALRIEPVMHNPAPGEFIPIQSKDKFLIVSLSPDVLYELDFLRKYVEGQLKEAYQGALIDDVPNEVKEFLDYCAYKDLGSPKKIQHLYPSYEGGSIIEWMRAKYLYPSFDES